MTVHRWLAEWSSWGWPLFANHLWQATIISFLAFAAAALLRKGPGRARYAVWLIASAKFVLPSALLVPIAHRLGIDFSSLLASTNGTNDGATVLSQLTAPIIQFEDSAGAGSLAARGHGELFCTLTVVWLTGSVVLLVLWLSKRRRFRLAMRAAPEVEATRERRALDRVRSWLGIKRDVRLSMLPGTVEPGVWGVWRPHVFIPRSMAEELSDGELEAVMMHEMVHVARWDNLIANLHRFLCCVLWFHPIVWMLDRLLLAEREQACDEEVIRLGGAPEVYASSLLKVLRFCLGWSVAGTSNATGSNLGRRVERIMSKTNQLKLSVWQRAVVGSIAALLITLSMAAGLLTRDGVVAQIEKPRERAIGGVPGGVSGGIPGGVPGGVTGFFEGQEKLIERLDQAPETTVEFKNSAKAPLAITEAKVRAVPREKDGPGDEFAVVPVVTLTNNSGRRIRLFTLEFRNGPERRAYSERAPFLIESPGVYTSGAQRRFIILVGGPEGWSVRVGGVVFEDGEVWGVVPPPPPPPPPPLPPSPESMKELDQAPDTPIQFTNSEGAPVSITAAAVRAVRVDSLARQILGPAARFGYLMRVTAQFVNNTDRRITGLAVECAEPESTTIAYASTGIEPRGSRNVELPPADGGFIVVHGNSEHLEARVVGVRFADGEVWGSFPPPPPPPPPPPVLTSGAGDPKLIRKSNGVLTESATHRVVPDSPPLARAARITGSVVVEVTVDEGGAVIAARAISGHPLLKDAAVNAARQWQFNPTTLSGVPVKVVGTLTFNFEP
jgi:TonB family protein